MHTHHHKQEHQINTIGRLKILNSRESKDIIEKLEEQYGYIVDKSAIDYIFLMNKDNRVYIVNRMIEQLPFDELKIDAIGLYFGEFYKESLRLSIEGAQFIGHQSTRNIVDIDAEQMTAWVQGKDLPFEDCGKQFVIVRHTNKKTHQTDILGCGKYKDGVLMNYVSKSRRLIVVNQ